MWDKPGAAHDHRKDMSSLMDTIPQPLGGVGVYLGPEGGWSRWQQPGSAHRAQTDLRGFLLYKY